ncbi:F-box/LRR-repeat protein 19-like isoform X3 [Petromyzon marinus]|uniref:F-box/LRR-repeat protein 19-like isoform X3 n=1 Tax=Petromyzon marinus TaxID=7757 RepID=A0AAJ7TVB1_PETMA|nr:F-box/LRR-repeat protein 19-like isoform X3 [Petromyzon marinus]
MANLSADEEDFSDTAEYRVGNKPGKARSGQASAAASGGGAGSSGGGGGSGGGSGGGGVSPGPGSASSSSAGPAQGQGSGLRSAISSGARRRRTRCRKCEACVRTECGECTFCKDMKKFGGPGKMKQSCIMRQCIAPILPHTAVCRICGEAGKEEAAEGEEEKFSMTLMECSICNEIVHPACLKIDDKEGVINDELPNCWECPKCNQEGKTGKQKRGPGFKYASNLPGSMLRECGERRRSEQDDAFPRRRSDEALKREHARSDDDSDADSRFGSVGEDDGDDGGADEEEEEEEEEEDEGRRRDRDEDEEAAAALEVSEAAAESVAAAGAVTPTIPAAGDAAMLSDHSPASPPSPAGSASPPPPEPPPPLPTAAVVAAAAAVQHTPANANRKGTEDGGVVSKKRKDVDGVQQPLGQKKKVKVEKAEKLLRKKKQKAVEVNNGRVESGHRRDGPAAWLERRGVASEQGRAWRGTDKQSSAAPDAPAAAAAAGPSGRENERKPNKHSRDAATAGITGGGSGGGGGGGGGVTAGEHRSKTRDANDRVRPAKPHATSKASSWGLHKPEQNSVGNSSAGRNNANNNSSSSNGNSGDGGAADSTNKNHHAPLVKSEEDGENGNNRTPRLFSSSERLQKAAKSLNGIPRGGPAARQPQQLQQLQQQQQQQAAGLAQAPPRLCGVNARLGGLPRPPSSVSPPKPHLLERHVIKPPLVSPPPDALPLGDGGSHPLRREAWLGVFRFLSHRDLCVCMRVCKTWNRWCCDRRLWAKIDLSRCKSVTPLMLSGIIKRQPSALDLSWSNVSKKQLAWLVNRLPGLKELVLSGCPWASVSALCGASWPPLRALDLRWAEGVKDAHIRDLLSPDSDYTPGAEDRLRGVSELRLAGLDITDASVALLVRLAAGLATLDLAHCAHLTDQAVNVLTAPGAPTRDTLRHLVLAGCARITDACLPLLVRCPHLSRADLRSCKLVTPEACQRLVTELCPQGTFALPEDRLIQRVTSTGS